MIIYSSINHSKRRGGNDVLFLPRLNQWALSVTPVMSHRCPSTLVGGPHALLMEPAKGSLTALEESCFLFGRPTVIGRFIIVRPSAIVLNLHHPRGHHPGVGDRIQNDRPRQDVQRRLDPTVRLGRRRSNHRRRDERGS